MSLIAQISQMGLAALQLPHGYWIGGEVTKMHLHFSEIKSQAGDSFVNLARPSLLYEMQGGVQNTNVQNTNVHNTNGSKYQRGPIKIPFESS